MRMAEELSSTLQNYLEAIFRIQCTNRVARVRDVAGALDVHKSTVSAALRTLKGKGLIEYEPYGLATLTAEGRSTARNIRMRHLVVKEFLAKVLGIREDAADHCACLMVNVVEKEVLVRFVCFLAFLDERPRKSAELLKQYRGFAREAIDTKRCEAWLDERLKQMEQEEQRHEEAQFSAEVP